ncbi:Receptor-like protein 14 [Linum grandiflorum]
MDEVYLSGNQLTEALPSNNDQGTSTSNYELAVLDLSHNHFTGTIPNELTQLTSLEVFDVAYNNLSGKCTKFTAQFGTFNDSIYRGNPFLYCTFPVQRREPPLPPIAS